jgi:hypothetical protein
MRLKALSRRGSIFSSRAFACSRSFSSSCFVSEMISLNSDFFSARMCTLSSIVSCVLLMSSALRFAISVYSRMRFSASSISSCLNPISFARKSNSLLLRTLFCCSVYFAMASCAFWISTFFAATPLRNSSASFLNFWIRVFKRSTSSSMSLTSKGSSPRRFLMRSIWDKSV